MLFISYTFPIQLNLMSNHYNIISESFACDKVFFLYFIFLLFKYSIH